MLVFMWLCVGVYIGDVWLCGDGIIIGFVINESVCLCDFVYEGQILFLVVIGDLVIDQFLVNIWLIDVGKYFLWGLYC